MVVFIVVSLVVAVTSLTACLVLAHGTRRMRSIWLGRVGGTLFVTMLVACCSTGGGFVYRQVKTVDMLQTECLERCGTMRTLSCGHYENGVGKEQQTSYSVCMRPSGAAGLEIGYHDAGGR